MAHLNNKREFVVRLSKFIVFTYVFIFMEIAIYNKILLYAFVTQNIK